MHSVQPMRRYPKDLWEDSITPLAVVYRTFLCTIPTPKLVDSLQEHAAKRTTAVNAWRLNWPELSAA